MGYRVRRLLGTLARLECLVFFPLVTQLALETCPLLRVLPGVCNVKCFCSGRFLSTRVLVAFSVLYPPHMYPSLSLLPQFIAKDVFRDQCLLNQKIFSGDA
jgi:hypothetical protein